MSTVAEGTVKRGRLILGTSGFSYAHWKERFYPRELGQSHWLEFYAERFCSVELNVSFYRLPARETFAAWARRTGPGFEFVVKGSQTITHYRRLKDAEEPLERLLDASSALGPKLTCMLWQLPPKMALDTPRLDAFCELLARRASSIHGSPLRHAFEFRDPRWFAEEVAAVLRERGFCWVFADPPREGDARPVTSGFLYLRFHRGPHQDGGYRPQDLQDLVTAADRALKAGQDVYAYFNNDPGGWAPKNAETFRELLGEPAPSNAVQAAAR